jgi:hypothetical protein
MLPALGFLPDGRTVVAYDDRWSLGGHAEAQPYLTVDATNGQPQWTVALTGPFNIDAITEGNDDQGPLGPNQGLAVTGDSVRVLISVPPLGHPNDVEVWQASVDLP